MCWIQHNFQQDCCEKHMSSAEPGWSKRCEKRTDNTEVAPMQQPGKKEGNTKVGQKGLHTSIKLAHHFPTARQVTWHQFGTGELISTSL